MKLDEDNKTWVPLTHGKLAWQLEYAETLLRNIEIRPLDDGPFQPEEKPKAIENKPTEIKTTEKPTSQLSPMRMPDLQVPAGFKIVPAMTASLTITRMMA